MRFPKSAVIGLFLAGCSSGAERVAVAPPPPPSRPVVMAPAIISTDPAVLVSDVRKQNGLRPVIVDPKLMEFAQIQSDAMAASGRLDHAAGAGTFMIRVDRSGIRGRMVENIAMGNPDFPRTLNQWLISPPHKENLLFAGGSRMGYAVSKDANGRPFWTLVIASGGYE